MTFEEKYQQLRDSLQEHKLRNGVEIDWFLLKLAELSVEIQQLWRAMPEQKPTATSSEGMVCVWLGPFKPVHEHVWYYEPQCLKGKIAYRHGVSAEEPLPTVCPYCYKTTRVGG